ncbi:HutD/Ves family protein [Oceanirhabdus sp. W0125-5]|uniref:HutD/Ves family protein n=1 Tax=Oceanirhabdus sp. W0125-5 TaxID=2999116 RepID=UPI0022F329AA|nr:HutD family protein [Oceanirhabdus sp. W0125-5]WBW99069.1 HutD family protein [Oceanirhabdus sp. W0125-5]
MINCEGITVNYNIEVIKKNDFKTSEWSGGTTTQLMIYPKDSLYSERNFKWRLSSAKVEVEESIFTNLPGIWRLIMVIEGELHLEHKGHHKAYLKPFQQDSFSGEYETRSFGKVTDFNLMMGNGCKGALEHLSLNRGESKNISFICDIGEDLTEITEVFYCVEGEIEILTENNEKINLFKGDLISVTRGEKENPLTFKFTNNKQAQVKIIKAVVYY